MNKPVRAVFDVNVLFSWAGWQGTPYRCVEAARYPERVESVSCVQILDKFAEKLRQKLGFSEAQVIDALADVVSFTRLISLPDIIPMVSGDAEDDIVLMCAHTAQARYIVSGDRRHMLPLGRYGDTQIVSPAEFAKLIDMGRE